MGACGFRSLADCVPLYGQRGEHISQMQVLLPTRVQSGRVQAGSVMPGLTGRHTKLPNNRRCHHLGHALNLAVACRWMRQQQHGTYTWPPLTLAVTYTITAKLMPFPLNTRAKVSSRVWRTMTPDTVIMHAHAARCQAHDPGFFYPDFGGSVQERSFELPHPDILCSCQASQQTVHNHAQPHQGAQFAAAELAVPVEF